MIEQRFDYLFKLVTTEVFESGGDGDGTVIFRDTDVSTVADAFVEWMALQPILDKYPFERHDVKDGYIRFSRWPEEAIIFLSEAASKEFVRPPWREDIWLEVY